MHIIIKCDRRKSFYKHIMYIGSGQAIGDMIVQLIGASLDAIILSVSKDTVKVCVTVDGKQDKATAKWFPYFYQI